MSKKLRKVDACIIGSGAGGGVVAGELSERGLTVVVLEAGRRFDRLKDYRSADPDWELSTREASKQFTVPALHKVTFGNDSRTRPYEVHGVGGGTLRYLAYAIRMRPDDFRIHSTEGVGMDWPISYDDLAPYYRKVEVELGVSGESVDGRALPPEPYLNPAFELSYANRIIQRGCDKLGIKLWSPPMARLSRSFDGRPGCKQCGACEQGCMTEAKSGVEVTYLRKAEATGRVEIRPQSIATRITTGPEGKVRSVLYFDKDGVEHEQEASVIIVSGGAIQSPRLLLNSTSKLFPDGLANSSGLVGKYFMKHIAMGATAIFPDRIDSYRGFFGGAVSEDLPKSGARKSYARGFRLDLHGGLLGRGLISFVRGTPLWGHQLKDYVRSSFGHIAGLGTAGEQLPDEGNTITVDPEVKDEFGMPVPRITYEWKKNDLAMLPDMERTVREVLEAAGAARILRLGSTPGADGHNVGTCRMGVDPKQSVLNSFCQTHDVSNLFVIDASCFVTIGIANPSLTIHAVAVRASQYIAEEARKGNL